MPNLERRLRQPLCQILLQLSLISALAPSVLASNTQLVLPTGAETSCATLLTSHEQVISTLRELYNDHVISAQDMIAILAGHNPLRKLYGVNQRMFEPVIDLAIVRLRQSSEARAQLAQLIQEIDASTRVQRVQTLETKQIYLPLTMYDIPKGTFMMGSTDDEDRRRQGERLRRGDEILHEVTITQGFRVADIPVTQWEYAFVMHNWHQPNPAAFKNGPSSTVADIFGRKILMQPNHPVERVKWNDAIRFIDTLNEWSKEDNPHIYRVISNHQKFARIRLLSESEWEYLVRNGGPWNGLFPDGISENNLHEYAWYESNSNGTTHPVGERRPLIIFGHPIFDLLGNVSEWTGDWYGPYPSEPTSDPQGPTAGEHRVLRGGGWRTIALGLRVGYRDRDRPDMRYEGYGFRIVEVPR